MKISFPSKIFLYLARDNQQDTLRLSLVVASTNAEKESGE